MIQEHIFVPGLAAPSRSGDGAYQAGHTSRAARPAEGSGQVGLTQQGGNGTLTRREDGSISARRRGVCDSLGAGVLTCSRLLPETIRTSWLFSQPVAFSSKELRSERVDIHSVARNEINAPNSDSSVALIKQSFCLASVTPRRRGDGRRVLSSPEDETSKKTKQIKERKREKTLHFFFLFFCSGWLISLSVPRVYDETSEAKPFYF